MKEKEVLSVRRLTHGQARMDQHFYWSGKTVEERLAGMLALNRRMYLMRGIDIDELKTDFTPRRVSRRAR